MNGNHERYRKGKKLWWAGNMKIRVQLGSLYDLGWNNGSLYYPLSLVTIIADNNSDNNWGRFWLDPLNPP